MPNVFGYYSDWYSTMAWLQPKFYGAIPLERAWGPATAESITGFTGALGVAAWFALAAWVVRTRSWRSGCAVIQLCMRVRNKIAMMVSITEAAIE